DLDEIDTVVDYLRDLRGVERVSFIGWSAGAARAGAYAARNPEKVDRVFLYAPGYNPTAPSTPPDDLPQPGFPTSLRTRAQQTSWEGIGCEGQRDPAIAEPIWDTTLAFDKLGRSWGPAEGVMRIRTTTSFWGWNADAARQVESPTLTVLGELDRIATGAKQLHEDLGTRDKVFVNVACASHFMLWERQHRALHRLSSEWLGDGTIDGHKRGVFSVDPEGEWHRTG
ncbi:MAG: alpha/beta hydrolase, partial [Actinomycetota bacterium]|nr:alpha/beta hydrolase [Actinomycetota bacterium]